VNRTAVGDNIRALALALIALFLLTSVGVGRRMLLSPELANDPQDPRVAAVVFDRARGPVLARDGTVLAQGRPRQYAEPSLAQVVGYASAAYGAAGIELAYGAALVGQDSTDPLAVLRVRFLGARAPPGSVTLGIDPATQRAAAAALAGRTGAVVALDPRTGQILASVSLPAPDTRALADPARAATAWAAMATGADSRPLLDRAAQGLYAPGSIFKIVTAVAALEAGVLDPTAKVRVDDPFQADPSWGAYAVRSSSAAHGDFDLSLAMARSENIYFAKAALATGGARLAETAARLGIGRAPALDLPASRGQLSRSGTLDRPTLVADTGFGQGELLVSPLQMALVAAAVANGGVQMDPHHAIAVRDGGGNALAAPDGGPGRRVMSADVARILTRALVDAVEAPGAFAAGARVGGLRVAGKTGTAENPSGAAHGWFVGFAPADAPTVAVAVVLEHAPRGGEDAAPIGAAVLRAAVGRAR